ncbi:calcitonin gene-related peptide type 1 receptor-like [Oncorhynchus masou masou]|uniref:calcitonin gene-related peptide type 1 receptor-like n=1 Tax=Oncorhynchus masou masou TaxID=90313 RepID=UPI003183350F
MKWLLCLLQSGTFARETSSEPGSPDTSLRPVLTIMEDERQTMTEGQYKCLELFSRDQQHNRTGVFCSRMWDGLLCWDETPVGTYATQNCPDYPGLDISGKVSKYCDESGNWVQSPSSNRTWSKCLTLSKDKLKNVTLHGLLEPGSVEPTVETPFRQNVTPHGLLEPGSVEPTVETPIRQNVTLHGLLEPGSVEPTVETPFRQNVTPHGLLEPGSVEPTVETPFRQNVTPHGLLEPGSVEPTVETPVRQNVTPHGLPDPGSVEPTVETPVSPRVSQEEEERKKIIDGQYKCFEKMNRDQPYNKSGLYCNRTWDGWLCWDDTPAGTVTWQNCPNYFRDFDSTEKATKTCSESGQWFRHPDSNRTWSNYTLCNFHTTGKLKMAYILYYMAIVGHALSIASLLISLAIFFYFRNLSCQRITLHKNLFVSYVLNSALTLIYLIAVVNNTDVVERNPVGCKVLHFFHMYMLGCNYFWMLCEGIYLHTLIVVAVFAEEQHLHWYYLLGWGFPLVPASIHAVARKKYFDDNCWMSVETHLLYVVHGPIMAALLVNLFFLLNIVRVLVTKLRDTHRAESNMYMKAVRATLILVPLLGIQFVIFPWRPENRLAGEVYDYIMHILMHYQGLLVATIFCFFNGEVQAALKRQWIQYKAQWGQRRRDHCSMRSTSYTATSITEVPAFMYHHDCNSEHLNGRHTCEDSELVALKTGDTYA